MGHLCRQGQLSIRLCRAGEIKGMGQAATEDSAGSVLRGRR